MADDAVVGAGGRLGIDGVEGEGDGRRRPAGEAGEGAQEAEQLLDLARGQQVRHVAAGDATDDLSDAGPEVGVAERFDRFFAQAVDESLAVGAAGVVVLGVMHEAPDFRIGRGEHGWLRDLARVVVVGVGEGVHVGLGRDCQGRAVESAIWLGVGGQDVEPGVLHVAPGAVRVQLLQAESDRAVGSRGGGDPHLGLSARGVGGLGVGEEGRLHDAVDGRACDEKGGDDQTE